MTPAFEEKLFSQLDEKHIKDDDDQDEEIEFGGEDCEAEEGGEGSEGEAECKG